MTELTGVGKVLRLYYFILFFCTTYFSTEGRAACLAHSVNSRCGCSRHRVRRQLRAHFRDAEISRKCPKNCALVLAAPVECDKGVRNDNHALSKPRAVTWATTIKINMTDVGVGDCDRGIKLEPKIDANTGMRQKCENRS